MIKFLSCATLLSIFLLLLPVNSHGWYGEPWSGMSRSDIELRGTDMVKKRWSPKNDIRNFGYDNTYHTYLKGTIYTGMAYSQNNPQETWTEFINLVNSTSGGTTGYGTDCSGFVSIAWKLPQRYNTTAFENDATQSGGYLSSLGDVGSGQNADLKVGDAFVKGGSHALLFKKRTSGGIITLEQTTWNACSREWSWSQLSQYRPIRRHNLSEEEEEDDSLDTTTGTVTTNGGNLNVRSGPGSSYPVVDTLANGTDVSIHCRVSGQSVSGKLATTDQWYRIGEEKFASAAYISASSSVAVCE